MRSVPWFTPDAVPATASFGEEIFVVEAPDFTRGTLRIWTGEWVALEDVPRRQVLEGMIQEVWDFLDEKGWLDSHHSFSELMVLLHTEISEAVEAYREYGYDSPECRVTYAADASTGYPGAKDIVKPIGVGPEMADLLVRLLHTCRRLGIDLVGEFARVMEHNRQRPYRHGKKNM